MRLLLLAEVPSDTQYLTLSHCWGTASSRPPMLTTENIAQLRCSLSTTMLTQTYRDAVIATRRLGFSYLWIDSLCIDQSNLTDWTSEAAQMASIYARATLNLVAADAYDGSDGMFHFRSSSACHTRYLLTARSRLGHQASICSFRPELHNRSQRVTTCLDLSGNLPGKAKFVLHQRPTTIRLWHFAG
jgi:hypothetical protein